MSTIDIQSQRVTFDRHTGSANTQRATFTFGTNLSNAYSVIKGFNIQYSDGDRWILQEEVSTATSYSGKTVTVTVTILLRDNSGNIDDAFQGWVDVVVLAQLS